ncbi:hypothetical protein Q31b_32550 [Novipirellula aureliae]|uniref:Ysc84 actin-binding domain-containing protein n=1 Tax=Novipirellula aureliae TaxID=2527966 RepID=A0A5C6DYI5_9BACT|nr:lipid-binding SYLF domain-containing protein [Novipirellula aureliae]TWU39939.1 hypothetical protein Q31b_32550 [Novipirellula aureliae]
MSRTFIWFPNRLATGLASLAILIPVALSPESVSAQLNTVIEPNVLSVSVEEQLVQASALVLSETMNRPLNRIPESMLSNASGVAIIPNVMKGSFIVGARYGRGLLFVREADGIWHAPVFITLTGGNIGWQVGVQSSDVVLVFKTPRSVQGVLSGKLTIGGDAAAAAGPVGRQAAIATDGNMQAEIYSYSRSRGLFAGVSIDGSVVQVDPLATAAYYQSPALGQPVVVPPSALNLTSAIATYANSTVAPPTAQQNSGQPVPSYHYELAQANRVSEADVIRNQIIQLAPQLYNQLDDQWKNYLALPGKILAEPQHPDPQEIQSVITRFDTVAANPAYQALASRPDFQSLVGLLKHYHQTLVAQLTAGSKTEIQLPPPPM